MRPPNIILIIGILSLSLFSNSCREEIEFPKKSFVLIDSVKHEVLTKSSAFISFQLFELESPDHVDSITISYYPSNSITTKNDTTIGGFLRSVTLKGLIPETEYCFNILVKTKGIVVQDSLKNDFSSKAFCFITPTITVLTDKFVTESDKELKVIVFGRIDGFLPEDKANIDSAGHYWISDNDTIITTISSLQISDEGIFKGELFNYDFTKKYIIKAYVKETGKKLVLAGTQAEFCSESEGDFWVNMKDLADLNSWRTDAPPALEGGVSFISKEFGYVGLGRDETGEYISDFWKYDPQRNSWKKIGNYPDPDGGRMHAVVFKNEAGDVFVGTGCNPCDENNIEEIGFKYDFYRFNPLTEMWDATAVFPLLDKSSFSMNNDKDLDELCGLDLDDDARYGAYVFEYMREIYVGGGRIKSVLEGDLINMNGMVDHGEWVDFGSKNGRLDHREWVDDGDGLFNIGPDWIDKDKNGKVDVNDTLGLMLGNNWFIDAGEWKDENGNGLVEADEWNNMNDNCIIDAGEWIDYNGNEKIDNIEITSEWDDKNGNGLIDNGDVRFELISRTDLWKLNPNDFNNNWQKVNEDSDIGIWGVPAIKRFNHIYLLYGEKTNADPGSPEYKTHQYKYNVSNDRKWVDQGENGDIEKVKARIYPSTFILGENNARTYICGGEDNEGTIFSFDLWEISYKGVQASTKPAYKERTACGLSGLTKGIGFSIKDKGYVGFGRVINHELTNELWVYIPCLKDCN